MSLQWGTVLQAELKQGKEEVQKLKAALLESEAAVLQKERQLVDLKGQMKEERRRAEAPLQMDKAVQADPIQHADLEVQVRACTCFVQFCEGGAGVDRGALSKSFTTRGQ